MEASKEQREKLITLIKTGQLPPFPKRQWNSLGPDEAQKHIEEGENTAPMTKKPPTQEQKNKIRSLMEAGLIPGKIAELPHLTSEDAETLTRLAEHANERSESPRNLLSKYFRDEEPATDAQRSKIKKMVSTGLLKPLSNESWVKLTRLTARKMIMAGTARSMK